MGWYGTSLALVALVLAPQLVTSQPTLLTFEDCTSAATRSASNFDPNARINVSSVYGQIAYPNGQKTLSLRAIAATNEEVIPSETASSGDLILSTLFSRSQVLTFTLNATQSWFCNTARPSSPLPDINATTNTYCPISPGSLAWAVDSPLYHDYNLTSIITRIRIVDPSEPGRELTCVDVNATPVKPGQTKTHNLGYPEGLFWLSAGLAIGYWLVIGLARISSAWSRGVSSGPGWNTVRWAGTVFASAVSAERLSTHSALLRYATPSYREVIFHTQWCAALAMVAVQWPTFAYPILSNTAWSALVYNITLAVNPPSDARWNPWAPNYSPPSTFSDQFADPSSPLYLDSSVPNTLYTFPQGTRDGMQSFAYAVGVHPEDLFGLCLKIWLIIVGTAVFVSVGIWFIDWVASSCLGGTGRPRGTGARRGSINELAGFSPESGVAEHPKEGSSDAPMLNGSPDDEDALGSRSHTPGVRSLGGGGALGGLRRRWWNHRLGQSSFHGSILSGNLVRLLIIFHFPITVFSTYEFSRQIGSNPEASSLALAALSFAFFSVIIPVVLILKLAATPTKKLYDATRTLLAYGPLYSHYAHGSQMFAAVVLGQSLALGVTIGVGQKSGTTQAIIVLVIEVASALATSIWLPWGERASMGVGSFLYCVARIVTAVLLIILSPLVSVGDAAGGWIAYAIIVLQGIVYLAFLLMLIVKIIEGLVRLFGRVPFDKATHSMDSGLLGALSQAGCCGARRKRKRGKRSSPRRAGGTTPVGDFSGKHTPNSSLGGAGAPLYAQQRSHSQQQINFLRPEHAFQPYREDGDDENGFIMGAWAGSGSHLHLPGGSNAQTGGYQPVSSLVDLPAAGAVGAGAGAAAATTGFSRVGGGRARFDDPFAALPSSSPSMAAAARAGHTRQSSSLASPSPGLPPGAMAPQVYPAGGPYATQAPLVPPPGASGSRHTRVQSHAAIIENAGAGAALAPPRTVALDDDDSSAASSVAGANKKNGGGGGGLFWQRRAASSPSQQRHDSYDTEEPSSPGPSSPGFNKPSSSGGGGGKSWFGRLMHRSEGDAPAAAAAAESSSGPSSFVVVRNKRPQTASNPEPPRVSEPDPEEEGAPKKSFVVVRPQRTSMPSSSLAPPGQQVDKRAST
ncbi:hypothetical protein DL93DRAFT_2234435 [Clavulina sp. PMI_390]|nr:hypothetical protein DL93DRAFT_2234435 [Clavulina sp. PMI_390]